MATITLLHIPTAVQIPSKGSFQWSERLRRALVTVENQDLETNQRGVILVLDFSGSMSSYWKIMTELQLYLADVCMGFPPGIVHVVRFDTTASSSDLTAVDEADIRNSSRKHGGGTSYRAAFNAVHEIATKNPQIDFQVIFQTDGEPNYGDSWEVVFQELPANITSVLPTFMGRLSKCSLATISSINKHYRSITTKDELQNLIRSTVDELIKPLDATVTVNGVTHPLTLYGYGDRFTGTLVLTDAIPPEVESVAVELPDIALIFPIVREVRDTFETTMADIEALIASPDPDNTTIAEAINKVRAHLGPQSAKNTRVIEAIDALFSASTKSQNSLPIFTSERVSGLLKVMRSYSLCSHLSRKDQKAVARVLGFLVKNQQRTKELLAQITPYVQELQHSREEIVDPIDSYMLGEYGPQWLFLAVPSDKLRGEISDMEGIARYINGACTTTAIFKAGCTSDGIESFVGRLQEFMQGSPETLVPLVPFYHPLTAMYPLLASRILIGSGVIINSRAADCILATMAHFLLDESPDTQRAGLGLAPYVLRYLHDTKVHMTPNDQPPISMLHVINARIADSKQWAIFASRAQDSDNCLLAAEQASMAMLMSEVSPAYQYACFLEVIRDKHAGFLKNEMAFIPEQTRSTQVEFEMKELAQLLLHNPYGLERRIEAGCHIVRTERAPEVVWETIVSYLETCPAISRIMRLAALCRALSDEPSWQSDLNNNHGLISIANWKRYEAYQQATIRDAPELFQKNPQSIIHDIMAINSGKGRDILVNCHLPIDDLFELTPLEKEMVNTAKHDAWVKVQLQCTTYEGLPRVIASFMNHYWDKFTYNQEDSGLKLIETFLTKFPNVDDFFNAVPDSYFVTPNTPFGQLFARFGVSQTRLLARNKSQACPKSPHHPGWNGDARKLCCLVGGQTILGELTKEEVFEAIADGRIGPEGSANYNSFVEWFIRFGLQRVVIEVGESRTFVRRMDFSNGDMILRDEYNGLKGKIDGIIMLADEIREHFNTKKRNMEKKG